MNLEQLKIRKKTIKTKSGELKTPFFMPDATRGFIKFLGNDDLVKSNVNPMVVNTYHLYLQPGTDIIKNSGGIHKFMNYDKPLLSDSGGYQVFSLIHKNPKMGKITDDKVIFRSPKDGSLHEITPEKSIQIQFDLGVDMMVCLDDPPPNNYTKEKIDSAVNRTIAWAKRCMIEYEKQLKERNIKKEERPLIFCVVQGGEHVDLRKKCIDGLRKVGEELGRDWDGYGFGARHIDENGNFLEDILRQTASFIPKKSLRFALGVGNPKDILRCVKMGWDMFDCVIPTREGRHGKLFIRKSKFENIISKLTIKKRKESFYKVMNIGNKKYKDDFSPVDKSCSCELCKNHSRAYLNHLFKSKDPLGMRLAAMHNLYFYSELMEEIRK
jgi:queuine tRNA-ribosyltransferase